MAIERVMSVSLRDQTRRPVLTVRRVDGVVTVETWAQGIRSEVIVPTQDVQQLATFLTELAELNWEESPAGIPPRPPGSLDPPAISRRSSLANLASAYAAPYSDAQTMGSEQPSSTGELATPPATNHRASQYERPSGTDALTSQSPSRPNTDQ